MMWWSVIGAAMAGDVVINEVMVNPIGSDGDSEWIELLNVSEEPVALSGWRLRWAVSASTGGEHVFGSSLIRPGDHFVISGEGVGGGDVLAVLDLGNASSNADMIQLIDADGAVVDTLVYGTTNTDGWVDDSGEVATSLAPKPSEGESLSRIPDGVDSDACGDDFMGTDDHTIGGPNEEPMVDTDEPADDPGDDPVEDFEPSACPGAEAIKLNEVMVNPDGADPGQEWIEIYNAGAVSVSLSGWSLVGGTSSFGLQHAFDASVELAAGGHLLVGGDLVPGADVLADLNLGNASSNADAVRLLGCDGLPADTLIYGGSNEDEWVDDDGIITDRLAPKPSEGSSLARISDGYDTNNSRTDWVTTAEPTPGYDNPYTEPVECTPGSEWVKINELMANPAGSDEGAEWVELFNPEDEEVSLDGWALNWGKNGTYSGTVIFPAGTAIGPGDFVLIGGEWVDDIDVMADLDLGNAGSNADAVQLVDCDGAVQDTVVYGGPNDDLWLNDRGEEATSLTGSPGDGQALARASDGVDTDRSGDDFVLTDDPSPGESNPEKVPVVCVPGDLEVKINELLPDPTGSDDDNEFVELYNTSSVDVSLDGWGLAAHTSKWPGIPQFMFPGGTVIEAGGFLVVGGESVDEADIEMTDDNDISMGNSSKNPDGVRLVDCTGVVQDTVLYGEAGEPTEDFELKDDLDGVSMAAMPREGLSVGRVEDGVDTNVSEDDFSANMPPTPGAANELTGGGGSGDSPSSGCGCGKSAGPGGGGAPEVEASAVAGVVASIALFVAMRRREDPPMENL